MVVLKNEIAGCADATLESENTESITIEETGNEQPPLKKVHH